MGTMLTASFIVRLTRPLWTMFRVLTDVVVLTILSLGGLASIGAFTPSIGLWEVAQPRTRVVAMLTATVGWVWAMFLFGVLLYETIWVLDNHGRDWATWKRPFAELAASADPERTRRVYSDIEARKSDTIR